MSIPTRERTPGRCLESALLSTVLAGILALAAAQGCGRRPAVAGEKGATRMTQLELQLKDLAGAARDTARAAGPGALPVLRARARSEDPRERALVLECYAEIGGDEAILALVGGLDDAEFDVRKTAVLLLQTVHGPVAAPRLRELLSTSADEWVRGNAALVLGTLDDGDAAALIRKRIPEEPDLVARRQMGLALARLEDGKERELLLKRLSDPKARDVYAAIADFEYAARPELLGKLLPLLSDTREVRNVGTEPFPVWHRVCDRAVEAVARAGGKPLPFPVGARRYTPEQIQAARERIRELSGSKK